MGPNVVGSTLTLRGEGQIDEDEALISWRRSPEVPGVDECVVRQGW